jgi:hypothetical protein
MYVYGRKVLVRSPDQTRSLCTGSQALLVTALKKSALLDRKNSIDMVKDGTRPSSPKGLILCY